MKRFSALKWTAAGAVIFLLSISSAHSVDFRPETQDDRVVVQNIEEDKVELSTPYAFHEDNGADKIYAVADWACGLFKRYAVYLSYWSSSVECDQMGAAQARREWTCRHHFEFACAIR